MFPTAISFEQYEILRELAKNDCGVTYKALARANQRNVGLRAIAPNSGTNQDLDTVQLCAKKAYSLSSPYIVHIVETFENQGMICLAMDYAEGSLLSTALGTSKMSDWDMADLARQLCSAIDHAASKNIFHPNLHPANIIQEWDGTVKLMDYGVVADPVQRAKANPSFLRALQYVSPEQAKGAAPDRRSNIYSLGSIIYEMVTGQNPISGADANTIIEKITNEVPPTPDSVLRTVHPALSSVIMKALAKSPDERYQTGADFFNAIDHYKDHQTVVSKPAPAAEIQPVQTPVAPPPARSEVVSAYATPPIPSVVHPPVRPPEPPVPVAPPRPVMPPKPVASEPVVAPPAKPTPSTIRMTPVIPNRPAHPPEPPKNPALKPTPRSEFLIIGPKEPSEEPEPAPPVVAPQPVASASTLRTATPSGLVAPVQPAATAVSPAVPVQPSSVPANPVAPSVSATPAMPARTPAAPRVSQRPTPAPAPARVPVSTTSASASASATVVPSAPSAPRVTRSAPAKKSSNQMPMILIGGGAVLLIVIAAVFVFLFWNHEQAPAEPQKQVQQTVPAEQPIAAEDTPVVAVETPNEPTRRKKKEALQPVAVPAPVIGNVSVVSAPDGALIELDGQATPFATPHTLFNLAAGTHTIRVSKAGYETIMRTIQVDAGQTASLNFSLVELRATVVINSDPDGASIMINGEKSSRLTPATVTLLKGKYMISLQKQGFLPSEVTVDAVPGQSYKVSPRLAPLGNADAIKEAGKLKKFFGGGNQMAQMGKVQFRTTPKGAEVSVNGKPMKNKTPMDLFFPGGHYELVLTLPGYKPVQRTITVTENAAQTVDVQFEKQ